MLSDLLKHITVVNKKTINSKYCSEMHKNEFHERYNNALQHDINNLSDIIMADFKDEDITIWHCCTYEGYGYYTISNGIKKRFVCSNYILESVGGCWSLYVYERLYMGQIHLIEFLEAVKSELGQRFAVKMPLKALYIAYILFDLEKMEKELIEDDYFNYDIETKRDFEIAREYQRNFTQNNAEQIEEYNKIITEGGDFWSYYNGSENHEYSCVLSIIQDAVNKIYDNRKCFEDCGLWDKARKVITALDETQLHFYSAERYDI